MYMVTPPYHFSIISTPNSSSSPRDIVYRGSIPVTRNLPFIRRLKLKTLVLLSKKQLKEDDDFLKFSRKCGVEIKWIKVDTMGEESLGMGKNEIGEVLKIILSPSNYPLYIADSDGISHTTLVTACLRKLQGWNSESILNEICRFEPDYEEFPLLSFINTYLTTQPQGESNLTLPNPPYPSWLWPVAPTERKPLTSISTNPSPPIPIPKEKEKDRPSSSTTTTSGGVQPLPFPNPLTARRHPTMKLTFPQVAPQPQTQTQSQPTPSTSTSTSVSVTPPTQSAVASSTAIQTTEGQIPTNPKRTLSNRAVQISSAVNKEREKEKDVSNKTASTDSPGTRLDGPSSGPQTSGTGGTKVVFDLPSNRSLPPTSSKTSPPTKPINPINNSTPTPISIPTTQPSARDPPPNPALSNLSSSLTNPPLTHSAPQSIPIPISLRPSPPVLPGQTQLNQAGETGQEIQLSLSPVEMVDISNSKTPIQLSDARGNLPSEGLSDPLLLTSQYDGPNMVGGTIDGSLAISKLGAGGDDIGMLSGEGRESGNDDEELDGFAEKQDEADDQYEEDEDEDEDEEEEEEEEEEEDDDDDEEEEDELPTSQYISALDLAGFT